MRGEYIPLNVSGPRANHVVAFARTHHGKQVINACGRFFMQLPEAPPLPVDPSLWIDTFIELGPDSSSSLTDVVTGRTIPITGGRIALADAFAQLPVAMLHD